MKSSWFLTLLAPSVVDAFSARHFVETAWKAPRSSLTRRKVLLPTSLPEASKAATHSVRSSKLGSTHSLEGFSSSLDAPPPEGAAASISSCWKDLLAMTRPSNLPGVVLLHALGSFLVMKGNTETARFWSTLSSPGMVATLLALVLTSSTSMLVNDYYDFKLGHDTHKAHKPLPSHRVTLPTVRRFVSGLYALALLCVAVVPGAPARATITTGLMLTFGYTQHLKPRTWLKNVVCASLIALSPLTSGLATLGVLESYSWKGIAPLLRLVATLFVGILGREMTMDVNDVADDAAHGIRTVPAVYGQSFATAVGLGGALAVLLLATSGPVGELVVGQAPSSGRFRRLACSGIGGLAQVRRSWQVFQTRGRDSGLVERSVDEGLWSVVLIMAGFV